jgi:hypothetical protein
MLILSRYRYKSRETEREKRKMNRVVVDGCCMIGWN